MTARAVATRNSDRLAAVAAGAAALLWIGMGAHQRLAHGTTELNEMRLVLGLTWMDTAKLLPLVALLLTLPTLALWRRAGPSKAARVGLMSAFAALSAYALGSALHYWSFAWGSYAVTFEMMGPSVLAGGLVQALSSFALALGFLLIAWPLARRSVWAALLLVVLVVGAVFTVFPTPAMLPSAVSWLALAAWLWTTPASALVSGSASPDVSSE